MKYLKLDKIKFTFSRYSYLKGTMTLKPGLEVIQGKLEMTSLLIGGI